MMKKNYKPQLTIK